MSQLEKYIKIIFSKSDVDKNGTLDPEEIMMALKYLGLNLKTEDIQSELSLVDKDGDGLIEYNEFRILAIRMIDKEILNPDKLILYLRQSAPSGRLSKASLQDLFRQKAISLDNQQTAILDKQLFNNQE